MSSSTDQPFTADLVESLRARREEIERQLAEYSALVEERDRIDAALAALRARA